MARSNSSRISVVGGLIVFALFVLTPLLGWAATVWTDYLWYKDLAQTGVFWTRIWSQAAVGGISALIAFALLFGNLRVARSMAPQGAPSSLPFGVPEQWNALYQRFRQGMDGVLDKVIFWGALLFAFSSGAGLSGNWETFRLALTRVAFGIKDPQFGKDAGFYVFTMPALSAVLAWLTGILLFTTVATILVHFLDGGIRPWERLKGFTPHVKAHLSVLAALIVALRAYAYWLEIFGLNLSPRGQVLGASYTDVHAQLPAYQILIVISLVTAVALLLNIRYRGWRLPVTALVVWLGASILVGGIWPALVQQFQVQPNEARLEAPYIARNIKMTRLGFGLADVKAKQFKAAEDLTTAEVDADQHTTSNVRLWDPEIIKQGYKQLQTIRPYYEFADVDVDRYKVNGNVRQVMVSAREMQSGLLADTAQTWVNQHLVYTHGFGLVISPASEADTRGLPKFIVGDVPPVVASSVASESPDLVQKQPRIYFGEDTDEYVIVNAEIDEFDYPLGEKNATYRYKGTQGIEVGSLPRRIAWALRLKSSQVLFSNYVKADSRVLIRRELGSRIRQLAPWLSTDGDPYPILADGRILWVIDAYTTSSRFPYAQRTSSGINYVRNSVKITVDAYTGETTFYAFDETDPVLKAWRGIFPNLITPGSRIPKAVRDHFRYPQGLFMAQAEMYRTYHMTDPTVFYNKEDQWQIPGEADGNEMEPFFVLLQLPGSKEEHFYLMQPYTPRNRDNMIGWMAASSDAANYGERTVYQFPKDRVILGPKQVEARINQDPVISPQLSLWNQRGSQVIFGNMVIIPIGNAVVYIQPLFLQAESTAIPELTRVVVSYADKVEMASTLQGALTQVFGSGSGGQQGAGGAGAGGGSAGGGAAGGGAAGGGAGGGAGAPSADAATAERLYQEAIAAQKAGDWATYGQRIQELGKVLAELAKTQSK